MVEVEVTKRLPYGSECVVNGVKTWIEFLYALHPSKLFQFCRTLDHARDACNHKRRDIVAAKILKNMQPTIAHKVAVSSPSGNPFCTPSPLIKDTINPKNQFLSNSFHFLEVSEKPSSSQATNNANFHTHPTAFKGNNSKEMAIKGITNNMENHSTFKEAEKVFQIIGNNNKIKHLQANEFGNYSYNPFQNKYITQNFSPSRPEVLNNGPHGIGPYPLHNPIIQPTSTNKINNTRKLIRQKCQIPNHPKKKPLFSLI